MYHFSVNVTILCWLFYKLMFRVGPGQLVLCDSTFICQQNECVNFNHTVPFPIGTVGPFPTSETFKLMLLGCQYSHRDV